MRLLNANPLVATADDVLSAAECAALIEAARGRLKRATLTYDGREGAAGHARTNSHAPLPPAECPAAATLCLKLSVLLRLPMTHAERPVALHYLPGQEFQAHMDGFDLSRAGEALDAAGGQRLFTTIVYLNRPDGGGATAFPRLGLSVEPAPGRLLVFGNTVAGTRAASTLSQHAGEPVTAGEKWAATVWWRERPAAAAGNRAAAG